MLRHRVRVLAVWWAFFLAVSGYLLANSPAQPVGGATKQQAPAAAQSPGRSFLDRYCVACHNQKLKTAGLMLDVLDVTDVTRQPEAWEKVVTKLRSGLMPPAGRPRPDRPAADGFVAWLEGQLDLAAAATPNPGRTEAFHRLNRFEYQNAVRDLLGVDIDASSLLPPDDGSSGFDNIAGVQRLAPALIERYLAASQKISRLALGAPDPFPAAATFTVPPDLSQDDRLDGLPFGTRGGTIIRYTFPRDGEYVVRLRLQRLTVATEDVPSFDQPQPLEVSVDGERVHVFTLPAAAPPSDKPTGQLDLYKADRRQLDDDWQIRFPVRAGPREIAITFLNRTPALLENFVEPFLRPYPGGDNLYTTQKGAYLRRVDIIGPFSAAADRQTPSRQRILVCHPTTADEEARCARTILSRLARLGYRRPVSDADVQRLMDMYQQGRLEGTFEGGIERALQALLLSPEFLFRVERDPAGRVTQQVYRISDVELASRLSFFLWSSIPDEELLAAAERGRLHESATLARQVQRMLADERSRALVSNFAGQWLFLRNVAAVSPDPKIDPDFDEGLRKAMRTETELFFESVLREDRSVLDLLTANYTFVNERLARHYGIPNLYGDQFRRVTVMDEHRRGLLGHGSILAVTSYPHRTSPVIRGRWILENLLGTPPPPPPPDVPALEESDKPGKVLSMRDRMARHRINPACASCHAMMDPLGLALENFDLVGRWREIDESRTPVNASGTLPDGTTFTGVSGLRQALLSRSDRFVATLTEKLLTYALGRGLEHFDAPTVRAITRAAARNEYRISSSLILGIVNSVPFQMRRTGS